MSISVPPILPVIAAQSAAPDLLLQPGSVIDAQVLQILSDNLVRIAIANVSLDVLSEIPLVVGQALQLAVSQTETGIRLAVVGQGAPGATPTDTVAVPLNATVDASAKSLSPAALPNNPLTPPERIALSAAAETAATRQQSLAPLFANLGAVVGSNDFPAKLQQAVTQVLAQRTSLDPELTGTEVKNAFQKSGLFLEAALASESVAPSAGIPDLKAALIVLRQTLAASLGSPASVESPTPIEVAPQPITPVIANPAAIGAGGSPQTSEPKPVLVLPQ
ncbi:MAG: flagellar hook-length control protein FliK, partial [Bryobacteraceae bacterium]